MSNRRTQIILLALVLAALVGVAALVIPASPLHRSPTLGLDLQGGIEVVLQAQDPKGERELTGDDISRSENIIRNRIDKLGVSEPEVRRQSGNQIIVQLAGVFDRDRAVDVIGSTASLELYKLEDDLVRPSINAVTDQAIPHDNLYSLLAPVTSAAGDTGEGYYLFDSKKKLIAGPTPTREALLETKAARCATGERKGPDCAKLIGAGPGKGTKKGADGLPSGYKIFGRPAKTKVLTCDISGRVCPGLSTAPVAGQTYYYLTRYDPDNDGRPSPADDGERPRLGGDACGLRSAVERADRAHGLHGGGRGQVPRHHARHRPGRPDPGVPAAERGAGRGTPSDTSRSSSTTRSSRSPTIDFDENPDGIPGDNGAQISGIGDVNEAKDLALVLQTGALAREVHDRRPDDGVGHARQGLTAPGPNGRDRRPRHRRAVPDRLLPLPRGGGGHRPRHLRGVPLRGPRSSST